MSVDNVVPIVIVAIVVISSVTSAIKKAKAGLDGAVAKQRADEPARLAAIKAELARRGVQAPPGMQGLISALQSAAAQIPATPPPAAQTVTYATPQPPYAAQPAYAPQAQYAAPPPPAMRRIAPIARSVDVPVFPAAPVATGSMRRTLATAFGDPAHARNAVVLQEVLGPPVALR